MPSDGDGKSPAAGGNGHGVPAGTHGGAPADQVRSLERGKPPGFLFCSCGYDFCADGLAYDRAELVASGRSAPGRPYTVDTSEPCGPVYWVWDDDTMSLADDQIQDAYRSWLGRLLVT